MASEKAAIGLWSFKKKLQSQFDLIQTTKDRPFIVPTAFGLVFGLVVLLLLMMALGSANNVLYLFVFFLASVSLSAMVITNDNLQRIRIKEVIPLRTFAGEPNKFKVVLANKGKKPSFSIEIKAGTPRTEATKITHVTEIEEVPALQELIAQVQGENLPRGLHTLPKIQIASHFPFGLLRSWKVFRWNQKFLVYPQRKGSLPFPLNSQNSQVQGDIGLFRDLREYQSSDLPRRIDWRASLKHDKILVKNFESNAEVSHSFSWPQTESLGSFESRISQMAAWIDQAETLGILYSMEVGPFSTESSRGPAHWTLCLEHLALLKPNLEIEVWTK